MRLDATSAGAPRSNPRSSAAPPPRNEACLHRRRCLRRQLLGVLAAACALIPACTWSHGNNPGLLAGLTAPGISSTLDPLGRPGITAGSRQYAVKLGHSVKGAELTLEVFGDGQDRVLVVGGIHGDEPAGATVADALARLLDSHPEFVDGLTVGIFAAANPDGLLSGQRANADGVDLNRNFPSADWRHANSDELSHGRFPGSEPETAAVIQAVKIIEPRRIIDIHSIERGYHGNNYDGPAEELAQLMSHFNGYPVLADIGYPTPGALGNWAGIDRGIPTVTLEVPGDLDSTRCWRENAVALLAFIRADFDSLGR
jgi:protein MpaA